VIVAASPSGSFSHMGQPETLEEVTRESRRRLSPSITDPHWLVLNKRREIFRERVERLLPGPLTVLDVGGRIQPYRPLVDSRLGAYIATDLRPTPLVNVMARGEQLPFPNEQFDLVICTQVLQYVPQPALVIAEVARVLKPGGYFFLSVPSACPSDASEECWRFLPAGLHFLLATFSRVEVIPEGRSIVGFFRTTNACFNIFVRYPALRALFRYTACPVINLLGASLERVSASSNDQFAVNYSVIAQK
jgi:SAM-dependent methyltransferase